MSNLSISLDNLPKAIINSFKKAKKEDIAIPLLLTAVAFGVGAGFLTRALTGRVDLAGGIGLGIPLVVGGGLFIVHRLCRKPAKEPEKETANEEPWHIVLKEPIPFFTKVLQEKGDITTGQSGILLHIFKQLEEKHIFKARLVCKRFREIIDSSEKLLYSPRLIEFRLETKSVFSNYRAKYSEMRRKERAWWNLEDQVWAKEKVLDEIPGAKNTKAKQELEQLKEKASIAKDVALKDEEELACAKREFELRKKYFKNRKFNEHFLDTLFGKGKFEELPVLENVSIMDYHISVKHNQMSASIMRGKEYNVRLFFTIRARDKNTNEIKVQTFFQTEYGNAIWGDVGSMIVHYEGKIMTNGKILEAAFKELKDLIENGENKNYILV